MLHPTRENAAVLFLDLQDEIVKNSRTVGQAMRRTALHRQLAKLRCQRFFRPSTGSAFWLTYSSR